jgi:membrane dipeptidase
MAQMFDVMRELRRKYKTEAEVARERRRWEERNPYPAGSIHDVVDHIDHIVQTIGIDHVGLGSDYDGIPKVPAQLEDVSTYSLITQELLNRGYKAEDIHKIMSGNILRVMKKAEVVAEQLAQ